MDGSLLQSIQYLSPYLSNGKVYGRGPFEPRHELQITPDREGNFLISYANEEFAPFNQKTEFILLADGSIVWNEGSNNEFLLTAITSDAEELKGEFEKESSGFEQREY